MEWLVVRTLLSLAGVLGLMAVVVVVVRRLTKNGMTGKGAEAQIEIIGRRSLHAKQSVVVLRTLGKVLVVGVSEGGMHTLTEISDPGELASLAPAVRPTAASPAGTFPRALTAALQGFVGRSVQPALRGRNDRGEVAGS